MTPSLAPGVAARAHRALDTLHALTYFVPEADEEFTGVGLRPGPDDVLRQPVGTDGAGAGRVVAATFYNFNPALVARHIPRAWGSRRSRTCWPRGSGSPTARYVDCWAMASRPTRPSSRRPNSPGPRPPP